VKFDIGQRFSPEPDIDVFGKQEFRRMDFGSRLLAAEGEGGKGQRTGVSEVKQYPSGSG